MQLCYILFQQITTFFIMMFMGYSIVKLKVLKSKDSKIISELIIYIILPCALLASFQIEVTSSILQGILFSTILAVLVHVLSLLLLYGLKRWRQLTAIEETSILYSNTGNMIIPIIMAILGEEYLIYSCAYMAVQLVFLWSHGQAVISKKTTISIKKICCNPNMVAILLGITLFALQIKLPDILVITLNSVKSSLAPFSMFVTGMLIADQNMIEVMKSKRVYFISLIRLCILPGILLLLLYCLKIPLIIADGKSLLFITVLAMVTPTSSTIIQLAQLYDQDAQYASSLNFISTMASILTMPLMAWIYSSLF